jgi:hypothetical protein
MTTALVCALVLVPGAGAALAFASPGTISVEGRVALAFGLGYALVAGTAVALALAHVFLLVSFVLAIAAVTAGIWALALSRAPLSTQWSALREQAREAPVTLATNLVLLLAVAVAWIAQPATGNLAHRSAWRYWADGLEIAADGFVRPESRQWGMEIPTTVSKVGLNAFEGAISLLAGPEPFPAMRAILVVAAVGLVAALVALGRELGLGIFSPLLAAFVVLVPDRLPFGAEISRELTRYTAENVGRMAGFCAVLVGVYAWRAGASRRLAALTGGLLAVCALTHGIPALVACLILLLYAVGSLLTDRGLLRPLLTQGLVMVGVLGVIYIGVVALTRGDLGFEGAGGSSFADFPADVDPTRSFSRAEISPPAPPDGRFLVGPRRMVSAYIDAMWSRPSSAWMGVAALILLFAASAVVAWRRRTLLRIIVVGWGLAVAILSAAFFFSYRYKTQIPGHFGMWRLNDYTVLVPAFVVPAVLAGAFAEWRPGRRVTLAVTAGIALMLALFVTLAHGRDDGSPRRAAIGLRTMSEVASVVPCDARMLVNARTAGAWEAITGRRALTEGRAPFLQSDVLRRVLDVLVGSNHFFQDPAANRAFLQEQDVDYVVVVRPGVWFGWGGDGDAPMWGDSDAVAALPDVQPVLRNPRVSVFAAGTNPADQEGSQPARCPL